MIEAEYVDRLGVSQRFATGDRVAVESAGGKLALLGVKHLRLPIDDTDPAEWLGWLLPRLSRNLQILPSIEVNAETVGEGGLLERLLAGHGEHFDHVELRCERFNDVSIPLISSALGALENHHKGAVASAELENAVCSLASLSRAGLTKRISAFALRWNPTYGNSVKLSDVVAELAAALSAFSPRSELWLTDTQHSSWRHQAAKQLQSFHSAISSPANRVYWHSLDDDAAADDLDAAAHLGLFDAYGQAKLLGRLLESGVGEVGRIATASRTAHAFSIVGTKPVLVTGGAGFIGANLADRLASEGQPVLIYDALARPGVERNLRWLTRRHPKRISFQLGDLRDELAAGDAAANARAVFHLAGQVAVTTSMVHPLTDFEVNARGTVALLENLRRRNPEAPLIFASTNKVYGDLSDIDLIRVGEAYLPSSEAVRGRGIDESRNLCFHTPYGCSKGTADQYVLDYAHSFGLRTAVIRMSCIYGERQLGTEDQGWVAHFLLRAIAGERLTLYGDGRQVRDILHVGDAVNAYVAAWNRIDDVQGRVYNLGGGAENAVSLLQLIEHIEVILGKRVDIELSSWRPGDQRYFVADTTAIRRDLSLPAFLGWRQGLARLAEHFGAALQPLVVEIEAVL